MICHCSTSSGINSGISCEMYNNVTFSCIVWYCILVKSNSDLTLNVVPAPKHYHWTLYYENAIPDNRPSRLVHPSIEVNWMMHMTQTLNHFCIINATSMIQTSLRIGVLENLCGLYFLLILAFSPVDSFVPVVPGVVILGTCNGQLHCYGCGRTWVSTVLFQYFVHSLM